MKIKLTKVDNVFYDWYQIEADGSQGDLGGGGKDMEIIALSALMMGVEFPEDTEEKLNALKVGDSIEIEAESIEG